MRRVCFPAGLMAALLACASMIQAQDKDKPAEPQPANPRPAPEKPGLPEIPDPAKSPKPAPKPGPTAPADPAKSKPDSTPAKPEPGNADDPIKPKSDGPLPVKVPSESNATRPTAEKPPGDKPAANKPSTPEDVRMAYMEERFQQLRAEMEDLKAVYASQLQKTTDLIADIKSLREENRKLNAHATQTFASQDDIKMITEKLLELDRKRLADRELILAEFNKMLQKVAAAAAAPSPPVPTPPTTGGKGIEHKVASGEFLSTIIAAYNEDFKRKGKKTVTMRQVLDANPGLKPERVLVGQKIFIPLHDTND